MTNYLNGHGIVHYYNFENIFVDLPIQYLVNLNFFFWEKDLRFKIKNQMSCETFFFFEKGYDG